MVVPIACARGVIHGAASWTWTSTILFRNDFFMLPVSINHYISTLNSYYRCISNGRLLTSHNDISPSLVFSDSALSELVTSYKRSMVEFFTIAQDIAILSICPPYNCTIITNPSVIPSYWSLYISENKADYKFNENQQGEKSVCGKQYVVRCFTVPESYYTCKLLTKVGKKVD